MSRRSLMHLSAKALLEQLRQLVARDRRLTVEILEVLIEVDRRRLWAQAGCASMYAWCMGALGFSEDVAAKRICAARQARKHPVILDMVADGLLHLSGLLVLAPKLREAPERAAELLVASARRSRRAIEAMLAERFPQNDLPTEMRPVGGISVPTSPAPGRVEMHLTGGVEPVRPAEPASISAPTEPGAPTLPALAGPSAAPAPGRVAIAPRSSRIAPIAPQRYAVQFTMDESMHADLVRAQELLSPTAGGDRVREVFRRALTELVTKLEQRKLGATDKPRKPRTGLARSRRVPAHVRRAVRTRDQDRCAFVAADGHRCGSRKQLEFDHVLPVAKGGESTVENVRLLCRAHNQLEAERALGEGFMHEIRERARRAPRASRAAGPGGRSGASPPVPVAQVPA